MTNSWNPGLYAGKHSFVQEYGTSLIDILDPKINETVLDLGCGTGELTSQIATIANYVVGIDASPSMIHHAQKSYPDLDLRVEDASNFDLGQSFDAIFTNAALHWVLNYKQAITCMYHHLKPGGRLVLEMGGKGNIESIESELRNVLLSKGYPKRAEKKVWFFPSLGEYTSALEHEGFRISAAWYYDRPTSLMDNDSGIIDWLTMFGHEFLSGLSEKVKLDIAKDVQERLAPELHQSGTWIADYKRLRILALKS